MIIRPQAGPQEKFLATPADIAIYGGAAGGGKSFALLMDAMRWTRISGYGGVIFRQTYGDITNQGGLWDTSEDLYPWAGAIPKKSSLTWQWRSGARVAFSHFQHEKYKNSWQGSQIPFIGWDELTHFSKEIFFYLLSRNRSACGVRPYTRATCNPDPDHWVRQFIAWWIGEDGYPIPERDGVIRWFIREGDDIVWAGHPSEFPKKMQAFAKSVTFIAAKLTDNPILMERDPAYMGNLMSLPRHQREALLGGNWNVRMASGDYFKRIWFEEVDCAPTSGLVVRYWDRAATEVSDRNSNPDYTAGVRMRITDEGIVYVEDCVRFRARPDLVRKNIRNVASQDGVECKVVLEEDPGQAGVAEVEMLKKYLNQFDVDSVKATKAKTVRARPFSAQCEAGNVKIAKGEWNEAWYNELESFPPENDEIHDDQVDASSGAYNYLSLAYRVPGVRVFAW